MKTIVRLAMILTLSPLVGVCAQVTDPAPPASPMEALHRSRTALADTRYDAALNYALTATEMDPAYSEAWKQLGRVYMLRHEPKKALDALDMLERLQPDDAELILWRTLIYLDSEDDEQLGRLLQELTADDFGRLDEAMVVRIFQGLIESGEVKAAIQFGHDWSSVSGQEPQSSSVLLITALLENNMEEAQRLFDQLSATPATSSPLLALAATRYGDQLMGGKEYERALGAYDVALAAASNYRTALRNKGWALLRLGRPDEALATWRLGVDHVQDTSSWLYDMTRVYLQQRDMDQALATVRELMEKEGDTPAAQALYVTLLRVQGLLDELDDARRELKSQPKGAAWLAMAEADARLLLDQVNDMGPVLQPAVDAAQDDEAIRTALSAVYRRWAETVSPEEAKEPLLALYKLYPDDPAVQRGLGWSLWALKQYDDATDMFERAVRLDGGDQIRFMLQVLAAQTEVGRTNEMERLKKSWDVNLTDGEIGLQLVQSGRALAALPFLEKAVHEEVENPLLSFYLAYARSLSGAPSDTYKLVMPYIEKELAFCNVADGERLIRTLTLSVEQEHVLEAVQAADEKLRTRPEFSEAWSTLLEVMAGQLDKQGLTQEAVNIYIELLSRDPDSARWILPARMADKDESFKPAVLESLERVEQVTTNGAVRLGVSGWLAHWVGQEEQALNDFEGSLKLDEQQPVLRLEAVRLLVEAGWIDRARNVSNWFDERLGEDPAWKSFAAEVHTLLRDDEMALALWEELLIQHPDSMHLRMEKARCLFYLGRLQECQQQVQEILDTHPTAQAWNLLTDIHQARNDAEAMAATAQEGLEQAPSVQLYKARAFAADVLNDADSVVHSADEVVRLKSDDQRMEWLAAARLLDEGELEISRERFSALLERNPTYLPALLRLKEIASREHDFDEAAQLAKTVVEQRPWDNDARLRYGVALAEAERFDHSVSVLKELTKDVSEPIPVLLYANPTWRDYPGYNRTSQIAEHMAFLAKEGYQFILPADLELGKAQTTKQVVLIFKDPDARTLLELDRLLQKYEAKAVWSCRTSGEGRRRPQDADAQTRQAYLSSGRWQLATYGLFNSPSLREALRVLPGTQALEDLDAATANLAASTQTKAPVLLYPDGDYGQYTLDTTVDRIAALDTAVEHNFALAFFRDSDGMITPRYKADRLPARFVPPDWTASRLQEHIEANDIRSDARLQLGKVLYWSSHHEEANKWFAEALDYGAEPAQVYYNWGSNADRQGDIPRALDLLQKAFELEPENPRIAASLMRLRERMDPILTLDYTYWEDNEDRSFDAWRLALRDYLTPKLQGRVFGQLPRWKTQNPGEDEVQIEGRRLGGQLIWHIMPQMEVDGELWHLDIKEAHVEDLTGGHLRLRLPMRLVGGHIDLEGERSEIDTIEAFEADIHQWHYSARSYSRWSKHVDLYVNGNYLDRDDDNDTIMADGKIVWRVKEWPFLGVGYYLRLADSDYDPPEYYAPEELQQHQMYFATRGIWGDWYYTASFQTGLVKEGDSDWRWIDSGRIYTRYDFTRVLHVYAEYIRQNAESYKRNTLMVGAGLNF